MGIIDLLLGRKPARSSKARSSRPAPSTQYDTQLTQGGSNAHSVRKDLLRVALRETLTRNGIPPTWISADMLRTSTTHRREPGLHMRFLVRHWEPRLLQHAVALEEEFTHRLLLLDPLGKNWLMGFSWQFALDDASACPPLPHPSLWTAPPPPSAPAPLPVAEPSSYGDVIEGPALEPRALEDVRADLERLLAVRDDDLRRNRGQAYEPTRPATL
jgi:hypothetical protein